MSHQSPPDLIPVIFQLQEDVIEAVLSRRLQTEQQTGIQIPYYFIIWQNGIFEDGFYHYAILGQKSLSILDDKLKDDVKNLTTGPSRRTSKSTSGFCEWQCGDHGPEGAHSSLTRGHAIPQRDFHRWQALKEAKFPPIISDIKDPEKNCVFLCEWRHARTNNHPPSCIMIPTTETLNLILQTMKEFDIASSDDQNERRIQDMRARLQEDQNLFVTRYDLGYAAGLCGKLPTDTENVQLRHCDILHIALKAGVQCQKIPREYQAQWPTPNDFLERSLLCRKTIDLFNEKIAGWLNHDDSRRRLHSEYLLSIEKQNFKRQNSKRTLRWLQESLSSAEFQFHDEILLTSPQVLKEPGDEPIHDAASSISASDTLQKRPQSNAKEIHALVRAYYDQFGIPQSNDDSDDDESEDPDDDESGDPDDATSRPFYDLARLLILRYASSKEREAGIDGQSRVSSWLEDPHLTQETGCSTANSDVNGEHELDSPRFPKDQQIGGQNETESGLIDGEAFSMTDSMTVATSPEEGS